MRKGVSLGPRATTREVEGQHRVLERGQRRQQLEELEHDADVAPRQTASSSSLTWSLSVRPSTDTTPAVGRSIPVIMFMIVVLPLPEGPTIATIWPSSMVRSTPRSAP